jgi:hypothetical protein
MKTLVYTHWNAWESAIADMPDTWHSEVRAVTEGEDGVEDIFIRQGDGWAEIRMDDPDAGEYWVAPSQQLALIDKDDDD